MMCLILSRDLMFSSQVSGAAQQAGMRAQAIGSASECSAEQAALVVFDLGMPACDISTVISELISKNAKVIAVGPHVHEEKLSAARAAGAHSVLTKGQVHRELANVLKSAADA